MESLWTLQLSYPLGCLKKMSSTTPASLSRKALLEDWTITEILTGMSSFHVCSVCWSFQVMHIDWDRGTLLPFMKRLNWNPYPGVLIFPSVSACYIALEMKTFAFVAFLIGVQVLFPFFFPSSPFLLHFFFLIPLTFHVAGTGNLPHHGLELK
jgi:hypothetical protein